MFIAGQSRSQEPRAGSEGSRGADGRRADDGGRRILDAVGVVVAGGLLAVVLSLLHLPSPALFGGLIAGLVRALGVSTRAAVPATATMGAQAVVGVTMGALIDLGTLQAVAAHWLAVLLVTVGTLALSLLAGLVLRLLPGISPVTGAFSMIAGGASGIVVMARELGADERMVAVLQYLRVLLIVVLMPLAATTVYGASPGSGSAAGGAGSGWAVGLLFTVGVRRRGSAGRTAPAHPGGRDARADARRGRRRPGLRMARARCRPWRRTWRSSSSACRSA